jgi:hypothetical protein
MYARMICQTTLSSNLFMWLPCSRPYPPLAHPWFWGFIYVSNLFIRIFWKRFDNKYVNTACLNNVVGLEVYYISSWVRLASSQPQSAKLQCQPKRKKQLCSLTRRRPREVISKFRTNKEKRKRANFGYQHPRCSESAYYYVRSS